MPLVFTQEDFLVPHIFTCVSVFDPFALPEKGESVYWTGEPVVPYGIWVTYVLDGLITLAYSGQRLSIYKTGRVLYTHVMWGSCSLRVLHTSAQLDLASLFGPSVQFRSKTMNFRALIRFARHETFISHSSSLTLLIISCTLHFPTCILLHHMDATHNFSCL